MRGLIHSVPDFLMDDLGVPYARNYIICGIHQAMSVRRWQGIDICADRHRVEFHVMLLQILNHNGGQSSLVFVIYAKQEQGATASANAVVNWVVLGPRKIRDQVVFFQVA